MSKLIHVCSLAALDCRDAMQVRRAVGRATDRSRAAAAMMRTRRHGLHDFECASAGTGIASHDDAESAESAESAKDHPRSVDTVPRAEARGNSRAKPQTLDQDKSPRFLPSVSVPGGGIKRPAQGYTTVRRGGDNETGMTSRTAWTGAIVIGLAAGLSACGGGGGYGGGGGGGTTTTYSIGGTITAPVFPVVLKLNGGSDYSVATAGSFTFPTELPYLASYDVTVSANPNCSVGNGSGTVGLADITTVTITCT
jgi:hypothetical protein